MKRQSKTGLEKGPIKATLPGWKEVTLSSNVGVKKRMPLGILYLTLRFTNSWVIMVEAVSSEDSLTTVREGPAAFQRPRVWAWPVTEQLLKGDRPATRRCAKGIISSMEGEKDQLGAEDGEGGDGGGE